MQNFHYGLLDLGSTLRFSPLPFNYLGAALGNGTFWLSDEVREYDSADKRNREE
jgi:hypothetical protein